VDGTYNDGNMTKCETVDLGSISVRPCGSRLLVADPNPADDPFA